jgi:NhaP-type Na+/H+ or K+/H+ antiporter
VLGCLAIVVVGALLAWGGYGLVRRCETKPEDTSFAHTYSPRILGYGLGYALVFTGLLAAIVGAPMFWISHSR